MHTQCSMILAYCHCANIRMQTKLCGFCGYSSAYPNKTIVALF